MTFVVQFTCSVLRPSILLACLPCYRSCWIPHAERMGGVLMDSIFPSSWVERHSLRLHRLALTSRREHRRCLMIAAAEGRKTSLPPCALTVARMFRTSGVAKNGLEIIAAPNLFSCMFYRKSRIFVTLTMIVIRFCRSLSQKKLKCSWHCQWLLSQEWHQLILFSFRVLSRTSQFVYWWILGALTRLSALSWQRN